MIDLDEVIERVFLILVLQAMEETGFAAESQPKEVGFLILNVVL